MEYAKFHAYGALAIRTREALSRVTMETVGTVHEAGCSEPPRNTPKQKNPRGGQCTPATVAAAKKGKVGKANAPKAVDVEEESATDSGSAPEEGKVDDGSATSSGSSESEESGSDGEE